MLTPELVGQIYKEVKKAYLKKDGTPFKREKRFWIRTLINTIAENLNLKKDIVDIGIKKLINNGVLHMDYMNTVYNRPIPLWKRGNIKYFKLNLRKR